MHPSQIIEKTPAAPTWRNQWDATEDGYARAESNIDFTDDAGMTLQAPAEEADLNVIMKRFGIKDGSRLPYWQDPRAIYGDFSEMPTDPVEMAEMLRQADLSFMALPAELRNRFRDGNQLYNWLEDSKNHEEAVKLGLLAQYTPSTTLEDINTTLKEAMVSSSTSSDKESLVPTSKKETGK